MEMKTDFEKFYWIIGQMDENEPDGKIHLTSERANRIIS